jgi:hypothetical protein
VRIVKARMVIGTFASGKREFEVPVTEYNSVNDAVNELGEEKALKFLNYAQRLNDLRAAREKNLTLHKGPEDFKTKKLR